MRTQYFLEDTSIFFQRDSGVWQTMPNGYSYYLPRANMIKAWDVHKRTDDLREQGIIE